VVVDTNSNGLERLAQLLRFRFGNTWRRSFVLLAAKASWVRRGNTDDQETQRLPVFP
jgi:hypothetical protein